MKALTQAPTQGSSSTAPLSAGAVHEFWFDDALVKREKAAARMTFWFEAHPARDRQIAERFSATLDAAARGTLADWQTEPRSCLALVIVLDQFPRNIYRGKSAAFSYDAPALEVTRHALSAKYLRELAMLEQAFLLMPFQHCEDLACQREGLVNWKHLVEDAAPEWRELAQGMLDYALRHFRIVERFGRFPHRNAILGRTSSEDELEYPESGADAFGQTSVP